MNPVLRSKILCLFALLSIGIASTPSVGQPAPASTTQPISLAPLAEISEQSHIGSSKTATRDAAGATTNASTISPQRSIGVDLSRMAIALAIVIGLIFGARWLLTHFFAGARAPATSRAIKVLGRMAVGPRQQVLLIQVGQRVVVVGDSGGNLSSLAQVEDPDEVASLVGQLQEEQIQRAASFGGLFGRMQSKFRGEEDEHSPEEPTDLEGPTSGAIGEPSLEAANDSQARSELAGLVDKVRSIREQLGRH